MAAVFGGWTSASRKAMLPVFEEQQGPALLPGPVRGPGGVAQHLLHRARRPTSRSSPAVDYLQGAGQDEVVPARLATTSSRARRTRSSRRSSRRTAARSSARSTRRSATPTTARSISKISAAKPDVVFNTLNGDSNVAFFKQLKDAGHHAATTCRHCLGLRRRGRGRAASAPTTSRATSPPGTTTRRPTTPENKKFVDGLQGQVRRRPRHRRPDRGRLHRRLPLGGGRREGRLDRGRRRSRRRPGGISVRRAGGHGHASTARTSTSPRRPASARSTPTA